MALHYLDPRRRAGTGAEPDVSVYANKGSHPSWKGPWAFRVSGGYASRGFATEAAALAAARAAAGFSHVAEKPCGYAFVPALCQINRDTYGDGCVTCAWPRDAHGVHVKSPA